MRLSTTTPGPGRRFGGFLAKVLQDIADLNLHFDHGLAGRAGSRGFSAFHSQGGITGGTVELDDIGIQSSTKTRDRMPVALAPGDSLRSRFSAGQTNSIFF